MMTTMTHKALTGGENKRALIATRITDTKLDPKPNTENHIMTTEIKADTSIVADVTLTAKRDTQADTLARDIMQLADRTGKSAQDIAVELFGSCKAEKVQFLDKGQLSKALRDAVTRYRKREGLKKLKIKTPEYYVLTRVVQSIVGHYAKLAKWTIPDGNTNDWDIPASVRRIIKDRSKTEVDEYIEELKTANANRVPEKK